MPITRSRAGSVARSRAEVNSRQPSPTTESRDTEATTEAPEDAVPPQSKQIVHRTPQQARPIIHKAPPRSPSELRRAEKSHVSKPASMTSRSSHRARRLAEAKLELAKKRMEYAEAQVEAIENESDDDEDGTVISEAQQRLINWLDDSLQQRADNGALPTHTTAAIQTEREAVLASQAAPHVFQSSSHVLPHK